MRKITYNLARYISKVNNYNKEQEAEVEYALRIIIFEALKIVGTIMIFALIANPIYVIVAVITMITTKPFIGGYHEDNQIKCFISTLIIIGSIIYLSGNIDINFISKLILNGISLYCIWQQAPIINPIMPITREELIIRNRKVGIIISMVFAIVSIIFSDKSIISNTIMWTLVFQGLFMFNKRK